MPQPTRSQVHTDAILTNISVAYLQDASHFIAHQVFPQVPVEKQSDLYYTYPKGTWFKDEAERRADGTESAGTGYGVSTDSYACQVYALHKDIGPQAKKNADSPIDLERDATNLLTQRLLLRQEIQWVADYFATSIWDTDVVGTTDFTKWDNFASSDPIEDIELGKETVLSTTGFMPNTLILGYQVFRKLKNHPDIVGRIQFTSSEVVTEALLAKYFGVDRVVVARAVKNTANEGATDVFAFTHGKHALLLYVAPTPSLLAPSAGYTFVWNGISDGFGASLSFTREEVPLTRGATRVEGQLAWDSKVVATDLGYFFSAAVS